MADQPTNLGASGQPAAQPTEDALLKAALDDVPLPAGLGSRIRSHIRAQYEPSATATAPALLATPNTGDISLETAIQRSITTQPSAALADSSLDVVRASIAAESDLASDEQPAGWLRRTILLAALAAGICGFAYLARQWTRPAEPSWLASQCDSILVQIENDNPANWQSVSQPIPASLVRARSQLVRVAIIAQRPLAALGSKTAGTVYRLDAGDGRGIFLMRFESLPAVRGLTSRFEILPTPSGGWSLAAMTTGEETFVLAANCTEQQIFSYIRRLDLT